MAQEALPPAGGDKTMLPAATAHDREPMHMDEGDGNKDGEDWMNGHWFVTGDWLMMFPRRTANDFAIVSPATLAGGVAVGSIESAFLNSTSALRVGTGYRLSEDGLELRANYTYLYTENSRGVQAPPGGTVFATMVAPGFGTDQVGNAIGEASLHYNIVDFELGRTFKPAECFSLWFSGGGRFAWIDQRMNAFYTGGGATGGDNVFNPVDFTGAGVRLGAEGNYHLGKGFSFFARGYGSLLMGDFHNSLTETLGAATIVAVSDRYRQVVPVTELGIGIAWKTESFKARIGYEITNWFNLVDSPDFSNAVNQGKLSSRTSDLSLDGLALELEFDF